MFGFSKWLIVVVLQKTRLVHDYFFGFFSDFLCGERVNANNSYVKF